MVYIARNAREVLLASPLGICPIETNDELAFVILSLAKNYTLNRQDRIVGAIGAIEIAKAEFERTVVVPHSKQQEYDNGAV